MQKVLIMYNLRKGVAMEDYRKWSHEVDQQITPKQEGVESFKVYEIKGSEKGNPACQIVEDVEVESWEKWQEVLKGKGMEKVVREWGRYGDADTVVVIWGDRIE